MNGIIKRTNNRTEIVELLADNKLCTDESEICEAFNVHFSGVGRKVQDTVPASKETDPCKYIFNLLKTILNLSALQKDKYLKRLMS